MESLIDLITAARLGDREPVSITCNYQNYQKLRTDSDFTKYVDIEDGCVCGLPIIIDESVTDYRIDFE